MSALMIWVAIKKMKLPFNLSTVGPCIIFGIPMDLAVAYMIAQTIKG